MLLESFMCIFMYKSVFLSDYVCDFAFLKLT